MIRILYVEIRVDQVAEVLEGEFAGPGDRMDGFQYLPDFIFPVAEIIRWHISGSNKWIVKSHFPDIVYLFYIITLFALRFLRNRNKYFGQDQSQGFYRFHISDFRFQISDFFLSSFFFDFIALTNLNGSFTHMLVKFWFVLIVHCVHTFFWLIRDVAWKWRVDWYVVWMWDARCEIWNVKSEMWNVWPPPLPWYYQTLSAAFFQ